MVGDGRLARVWLCSCMEGGDVCEVIFVRCDSEVSVTGYIGKRMKEKKNPSNFYIDEQSVNASSMTAAFSRPSY